MLRCLPHCIHNPSSFSVIPVFWYINNIIYALFISICSMLCGLSISSSFTASITLPLCSLPSPMFYFTPVFWCINSIIMYGLFISFGSMPCGLSRHPLLYLHPSFRFSPFAALYGPSVPTHSSPLLCSRSECSIPTWSTKQIGKNCNPSIQARLRN